MLTNLKTEHERFNSAILPSFSCGRYISSIPKLGAIGRGRAQLTAYLLPNFFALSYRQNFHEGFITTEQKEFRSPWKLKECKLPM